MVAAEKGLVMPRPVENMLVILVAPNDSKLSVCAEMKVGPRQQRRMKMRSNFVFIAMIAESLNR